MITATGIHIVDHILRLVTLSRHNDACSLIAMHETPLEHPFDAPILEAENQASFFEPIQKILSNLPTNLGHLSVVLTGGLFHIQKVPLEVASEEDRREQIVWEASQALIPPADAWEIDFLPAGRVAFWTAFRKQIAALWTDWVSSDTPQNLSMLAEPLALYAACHLANGAPSGRQAAIHLGKNWLSFIATDEGALVSAETINLPTSSSNQTLTQQIRHLLQGEVTNERRGTAFGQTHFCGPSEILAQTCQQMAKTLSPPPIEMQPFANIDTHALNTPQLFNAPGAFAVAAGAAYWHLHKDDPTH